MIKRNLWIVILLLFTACQEKAKPIVIRNPDLAVPISCIRLNSLGVRKAYIDTLNKLYTFDKKCDLTLSVSYKKDIVCNSTQNVQMKNMGKFPISFLKLELRKGLELKYSYYVDLYSNVDEDDLEEGFERLKEDLLINKGDK